MASPWVKVQNFQNPELLKIKSYNLHNAYKYQQSQNLNGQLSLDKQIITKKPLLESA